MKLQQKKNQFKKPFKKTRIKKMGPNLRVEKNKRKMNLKTILNLKKLIEIKEVHLKLEGLNLMKKLIERLL